MTAIRHSLRVLQLPKYGWLPKISNVQIQTHSRCNADCVFCPYSESSHAADPGRMTDETWHLILSNLRPWSDELNKGKICPYLMQEPLIDHTIFSKIADLYRCWPKTCVEVSTNGAALTATTAQKLLELFRGRRHELWISHHGTNAATLEEIMRIDYEKATRNAISLLVMSNGQLNVKIRGAGESKDGKHKYFTRQEYLNYWDKLFKDNKINRKGIGIDWFKFHDRAATLHRDDGRHNNQLNMGTVREIDKTHPFHCSRIDEWLHFKYNGDVVICCMDYHNEVKLPNVNNLSLLEYFHSPEYYDLVGCVSGQSDSPTDFICKRCTSPGG